MKNKPKISEFNHIAIIQTAFLGDVALTIHLATAIKSLHRDVKITFVTTPQAASILATAKDIDSVVKFNKRTDDRGIDGIKRMAGKLERMDVDCILAPHRSMRTSLLAYYSQPKYSVGFKSADFSFIYNYQTNFHYHLHEFYRILFLLDGFDNVNPKDFFDIKPKISFNEEEKIFVNNTLFAKGLKLEEQFVAIAPSSVWNTKRWQPEKFASLAKKINDEGYKVLLLGSNDDMELCDGIALNSGAISLAGKTNLLQSQYVLSLCKVLITNDSAPTHLANLVGTPCVTIYGPTSSLFGFYPRGIKDAIIEIKDLKCRPCEIHGGDSCPIQTHDCMKLISVDMVHKKVNEILNQ